jgi:hypothetical protein
MFRLRTVVLTAIVAANACLVAPTMSQSPGAGSETPGTQTLAAAGQMTAFAGLRLWANQWEISNLQSVLVAEGPQTLVRREQLGSNVSKTEFVPIPVIGVRYDKFVASASYLPKTSYDSQDPTLGKVKRDELDLNVGYSVLPTVVISLGYKRGTQDRLTGQLDPTTGESIPSGVKVEAILLGASASVPLAGRFSFYGNVAYGVGRNKTDFVGATGETRFDSDYKIGEIGVSYAAYEGGAGAVLKSVLISVGYRAQVLTSKDLPLGTYTVPGNSLIDVQHVDVKTTTDGFVVGLVGVF